MLKELQSLRFRIGRAKQVFAQFRQQAYEQFLGINSEELERRYQEYVKSRSAA